MSVRNEEVIRTFVTSGSDKKGSSVSSRNGILYSYGTAIAELYNGSVIVNITKYSVTTSTAQNKLRGFLERAKANIIEVQHIPQGATNLNGYVCNDYYKV